MIFNPSFPYRFTHMMLASGFTGAFLVAGSVGLAAAEGARPIGPRTTLRTGIVIAAVLAPLQVFVGDLHGLNTLEHQPAKIAAMEALWETRTRRAAGAVRDSERAEEAQRLRDRDSGTGEPRS